MSILQSLPAPMEIYPTLLQSIIPKPLEITISKSMMKKDLWAEIQTIDYDPGNQTKMRMDLCVYNTITLKCKYSPETDLIVRNVIKQLN